jgi:hypothetical protein
LFFLAYFAYERMRVSLAASARLALRAERGEKQPSSVCVILGFAFADKCVGKIEDRFHSSLGKVQPGWPQQLRSGKQSASAGGHDGLPLACSCTDLGSARLEEHAP